MQGVYKFDSNDLQITTVSQKFSEDSVCFEDESWIIASQGVFLNDLDLKKEYQVSNTIELIKKLLCEKQGALCKKLFGSYVIVALQKKTGTLTICNDLLSKQSLYYAFVENGGFENSVVVFSDSFWSTVSLAKEHGITLDVDSLGIKMMNRHRMFYGDVTYVEQIKFLKPYSWLKIENNGISLETLDTPQKDEKISKNDAILRCHKLFGDAVRLQYEKNERYNYKHITTLSGGMDSKTTFLYGLRMGYKNQVCYTYAESNSADSQIPQMIADGEGCQFFFHSITNGNFLLKRDEIAEENEGQMVYGGTTGLFESIEMYDTTRWGLVHTGVGGGEIMGDLCVANAEQGWTTFIDSLDCTEQEKYRIGDIINKYKTYNEFANLNDMRRCLNSQKTAKRFCEYMSPFLYEPFLSLC